MADVSSDQDPAVPNVVAEEKAGKTEETTKIPLDDDDDNKDLFEDAQNDMEKSKSPAASIDVTSQNGEKETVKSEEEIKEEESGDTFDIEIVVSDPEKIGDGMGAYMAYKVSTKTSIPSFKSAEFSVKRRFSDFLGLHERLVEKHLPYGRIVPPAPEKSVVGMTKVKMSKEETPAGDFVERRKASLERFLNRTAKHHKLREDPDFKEFLEAEELPRATNTSALSKGGLTRLVKNVGDAVSKITHKMTESDQWFEEKHNQIENLDQQLRKLHLASESMFALRKELGVNTASFAKSISLLSSAEEHSGLSKALTQLAELEEKIEQLQLDQSTNDFYVLCETLKDYIGLIGAVKASFQQRVKVWQNWQSSKATLTKKREALVKAELAGKSDRVALSQDEVKEWERRVEKCEEEFNQISQDLKKELTRFEFHRINDFQQLIVKYLESLLNTQQELIKHWEGFLPEAKAIM